MINRNEFASFLAYEELEKFCKQKGTGVDAFYTKLQDLREKLSAAVKESQPDNEISRLFDIKVVWNRHESIEQIMKDMGLLLENVQSPYHKELSKLYANYLFKTMCDLKKPSFENPLGNSEVYGKDYPAYLYEMRLSLLGEAAKERGDYVGHTDAMFQLWRDKKGFADEEDGALSLLRRAAQHENRKAQLTFLRYYRDGRAAHYPSNTVKKDKIRMCRLFEGLTSAIENGEWLPDLRSKKKLEETRLKYQEYRREVFEEFAKGVKEAHYEAVHAIFTEIQGGEDEAENVDDMRYKLLAYAEAYKSCGGDRSEIEHTSNNNWRRLTEMEKKDAGFTSESIEFDEEGYAEREPGKYDEIRLKVEIQRLILQTGCLEQEVRMWPIFVEDGVKFSFAEKRVLSALSFAKKILSTIEKFPEGFTSFGKTKEIINFLKDATEFLGPRNRRTITPELSPQSLKKLEDTLSDIEAEIGRLSPVEYPPGFIYEIGSAEGLGPIYPLGFIYELGAVVGDSNSTPEFSDPQTSEPSFIVTARPQTSTTTPLSKFFKKPGDEGSEIRGTKVASSSEKDSEPMATSKTKSKIPFKFLEDFTGGWDEIRKTITKKPELDCSSEDEQEVKPKK